MQIDKVVTLKSGSSGHVRVETDKCHDANKENIASSNTPKRVFIKVKLMQKKGRKE